MNIRTITTCRSCGSNRLEEVFDLGPLYISNFLKPGQDPGPKIPLTIVRCADCTLAQLTHTVDQDVLYKGQYWYKSGTNASMRAALKDVVEDALAHVELKEGDIVVDIGANDGTMLAFLPDGIIKVACEPSPTFHDWLLSSGYCLVPTYWSADAYAERVSSFRGNQGEDSKKQRSLLAGDGRRSQGDEGESGNQGQNERVKEASSSAESGTSGEHLPKGKEPNTRDQSQDAPIPARTVWSNNEHSDFGSIPLSLQGMAEGSSIEGKWGMPDLRPIPSKTASGSHQTLFPVSGIEVRDIERASTLPVVSWEAWLERKEKAKIIFSIACFYDLDEPNGFIRDVKDVLSDDGIWIVQMAYLESMLKMNMFDNICHEHLTYFDLTAFERLIDPHGLMVLDAKLNDVNGGSIRIIVGHADRVREKVQNSRVFRLRDEEQRFRTTGMNTWGSFKTRVEDIKGRTVDFIETETKRGKTFWVYGASTKGNTLLQYYGLDNSVIMCAVDANPDKRGLMTVGSKIPIYQETAGQPDYYLALPWHFIDGFLKRERSYLDRGGKFLVPLPDPRIIDTETTIRTTVI